MLLTSQVDEWKEYYIDYKALKKLIKKAVKAKHQHLLEQQLQHADDSTLIQTLRTRMRSPIRGKTKSSTSLVINDIMSDGCVAELEFRRMLDHEIQKIVLFVMVREGQLAERLFEMSKDGQSLKRKVASLMQEPGHLQDDWTQTMPSEEDKTDVWAHLKKSTDRHRAFAQDLLQFVNFVDMNLTGHRKILKKHDKNFPHNQLSGIYLNHAGGRNDRDTEGEGMKDCHLERLYNFGGLSALILSLRRAFDDLYFLELHLLTLTDAAKTASQHQRRRRNRSMPHISSYDSMDTDIEIAMNFTQHNNNNKSPIPSRQLSTRSDSAYDDRHDHMLVLNSANQPSHLLSTTITCQREPILDQINAARSRLRQTSKYAELVAAQALIFVDKDQDGADDEKTPASEFTSVQKLSSMLNLVSTFLYMANYYIVAPTVGNYALRLGSDESMSGYIIGMTPNAALIATVLYGFWSNYSYRNPLIFAAVSSFCGNIFYALALRYNSINMVLIGRFLVGFGSARSINRRYIADVFSKADRTAASADFVTYAALGMAAGPAAAFGVGHLSFNASNLFWSDVNATAWIMMVVWGIFIVALVAFFEEPDRSHLYGKPASDSSPTLIQKMEMIVTNVNLDGIKKGEIEPLIPYRNGDLETYTIGTSSEFVCDSKEPPLWKNVAVMVSLWMYFVLKLVLEMLMSSTSTIAKYYFSWDSKQSGLFLACVALLMFPVNFVVAKLSQKYEDRELIVAALLIMLISVLGVIDYDPDSYSVYQYVIFGVGIFLSTNGLEGVNMSLLSKTIPTSWARGTFNSGFLATEAGTFARSTGDVLISAVAGSLGMGMLLNGLFAPMALLCAISLLMVFSFYDKLTDMDEDEDDEISN